jgi:hypothetical protein
MKFKKVLLLCSVAIAMLIQSCKKQSEISRQEDSKAQSSTPVSKEVLDAILKMGFDTTGVIPFRDGYVVEGDILVKTEDLLKVKKVSKYRSQSYSTDNLVGNLPRVISVSVTGLPQNYIDATINMIARYNQQSLKIQFSYVTGTVGDINIVGFYERSRLLGQSGFPSNGNPYPSIFLNTYHYDNAPLGFLTSVIQHEVGHCIGFRHTDYMDKQYSFGGCSTGTLSDQDRYETAQPLGANHIPGTSPSPSFESFMLAFTCNNIDRNFNPEDIIALYYLYGISQTPDAQPISQFYSPGQVDHFTTSNRNATNPYGGWEYRGADFKAFLTQVSGSVPVYNFYQADDLNHFLTPDINATNGFQGWQFQHIEFYAFPTQQPGTIPVYLFYNASLTDHYVSANPNATGQYPGWENRGVTFYALPN